MNDNLIMTILLAFSEYHKSNYSTNFNRLSIHTLPKTITKMSSYGYGFCPQSPSYTAMKYMRTYIPHRALLPGERYRLHLDMEAKVRKLSSISKCKISRVKVKHIFCNSIIFSLYYSFKRCMDIRISVEK